MHGLGNAVHLLSAKENCSAFRQFTDFLKTTQFPANMYIIKNYKTALEKFEIKI